MGLENTDEAVYFAYPRHVGKVAALKAIRKAVKTLARTMGEQMARDTLMEAVVLFSASPAGDKGIFTPHPATFFNQGRYLDDPQEWYREDTNGNYKSKTESSVDAARVAIERIENRRRASEAGDTPSSEDGSRGLRGIRA